MKITPELLLSVAERRGFLNWLPTKMFLSYKYRRCTHTKMNWKNPVRFTEKLQVLKMIYAGSPKLGTYTRLADKVLAKKDVAAIIGDEYIIPTLGKWDRFDDIPFDTLPDSFVLKTNHDSGGVVVCEDKAKLDMAKAKTKLEKTLKWNFYWYGREPQYRDIEPCLFAEEFVADAEHMDEFKIYCFGGKARCVLSCHGVAHGDGRRNTFYDTDFNRLPIRGHYPPEERVQERPEKLDEILALSERLAAELPEARVDWYLVGGKIYFGEITFFDNSGFTLIKPDEWNLKFGEWLTLPSTGESKK